MLVLQAFNVSHQFDNGETLFQSISCSMTKRRVGLVGRNGIGKSLLASILAGETQPASGVVTSPSSFMMYRRGRLICFQVSNRSPSFWEQTRSCML